MKRWMLVGTAVAAIGLGACGGGETATDASGGGEGGGATALSMVDNAYQPGSLAVASGATVEVTNDGQAPHTVTIEGADINEAVEPGQSTSVTFDLEPGEYTMYCEYHRDAGMEGTLTVS